MNGIDDCAVQLPRYQCHKVVWALKIKAVETGPHGSAIIYPEEPGYGPVDVDIEYLRKHQPEVGGYYVIYDDGYKSWSPAAAFESGYTRIK